MQGSSGNYVLIFMFEKKAENNRDFIFHETKSLCFRNLHAWMQNSSCSYGKRGFQPHLVSTFAPTKYPKRSFLQWKVLIGISGIEIRY